MAHRSSCGSPTVKTNFDPQNFSKFGTYLKDLSMTRI